jgi:hypothetical protein
MSTSEQEKYPLTLEHIKRFLATKQDKDTLGMCHRATYCLLSETLQWLYPGQDWRVDIGIYIGRPHNGYTAPRLDMQVDFLRRSFDFCTFSRKTFATKADLKIYLEWREEHPDEDDPMPFAVTDLFPEEQTNDH